ncbi:MAG: ABC transporter permease [Candidatus Bathyarchaeia archaeon]
MPRSLKILMFIVIVALLLGLLAHFWLSAAQRQVIRIATTTSVYDSGLLDAIIPVFERRYNLKVMVISVGSGQALEIAKRGEADIVLVHSRDQELKFIEDGFGVHRVGIMYNDFIIVGPIDDPAGIRGLKSAAEAFRRISKSGSKFISRADMSGTHMMELNIWRSIGIKPASGVDAWYIEANRGMGSVLRMADEMAAYTLIDRATWLTYRNQLNRLVMLVECDPPLYNPYSLILVNPERKPYINYRGALTLAVFLISKSGQELIGSFKRDGEVLFKPLAWELELAESMGYPGQAEELSWYLSQETYGETAHIKTLNEVFFWEILNITALSIQVSLLSVAIGSVIGIPIGVLLGFKGPSKKRIFSRLVEVTMKTSINTLMGLPPVIAGLIVFLLFNRFGPLGFLGLLYTPAAMVITQVILVTPIVIGITMSAIAEVKEPVRERALSLGATERQAAWAVVKEAKGGVITAITVAFGAAISEVGGIMIAGGNIRWYTRTLTTAIITEVELGNFGMALTLGIILLCIAFTINLALTIMQTKGGRAS